MKKENKLYIFASMLITFFIIVGVTYAWMVTSPSEGSIIEYNKTFIIASNDLTATVSVLHNNEYAPLAETPVLNLLEPGKTQRFRFEITNNSTLVSANVKIIFGGIQGDLNDLSQFVYFGETSPRMFRRTLADVMLASPDNVGDENDKYYFVFMEDLNVPADDTVYVYWYVMVSKSAENELMEKTLDLGSFSFISG